MATVAKIAAAKYNLRHAPMCMIVPSDDILVGTDLKDDPMIRVAHPIRLGW